MKSILLGAVVLTITLAVCGIAAAVSSAPDAKAKGADRDEHGCIGSAGYSWCERTGECERPWELAEKHHFARSQEAFDTFCQNPMQTSQADCDKSGKLLGGWTTAKVTPEVEAALDTVLTQMNTSAKLEKILGVKTQVVAGMNYAIDFQLDNGGIWHTRVFRDLSGNYTMTQPATQGAGLNDCP